jgi:pimeloyl-ACP methyl ester carboxylesterase
MGSSRAPRIPLLGWDAIYYTLTGPAEAPVVLLLHGLGSCGDDWAPQIPALIPRYRVLTVDLPGHHRSARPRGPLSIVTMARALDALLARLAIERAHVVGLSLGGCVGLALALEAPARVESLTVVNAFARLRPAGVRAALRGAGRALLAVGAPMRVVGAYVAREAFPRPEHAALREAAAARIGATVRGQYLAALGALARFDVRHRLGEVRCRTLVVAGARDTTVPLGAKRALADAIPGARFMLLDESGHVSPHDDAGRFNEVLLAHLAGSPRA